MRFPKWISRALDAVNQERVLTYLVAAMIASNCALLFGLAVLVWRVVVS